MINKTKNRIYPQLSPKGGCSSTNRFYGWKNWKRLLGIFAILALIFVWTGIRPTEKAQAAGIDAVATTLVTTEAIDGQTQITIAFDPITPVIVTDVISFYLGDDTNGDPWVDTDNDIDGSDVTCAGADYTFDTYVQLEATGSSPMLFQCTVTAVNDGTNTITMTVGNGVGEDLYNPSTADNYPSAVVTPDDSGAGVAYVGDANDVTVSVTVLPNLSFLIDSADGVDCVTTSGLTTCALGVVLTTTTVDGDYDVQAGTNAGTGASIFIAEDGDLGSITDFSEDSGTITAGTDEYGIEITEIGVWVMQGVYTDNDSPIEGGATLFAQYTSPIAESGDDINVKHVAAIDSTIPPGSHSHVVTWTATGNF